MEKELYAPLATVLAALLAALVGLVGVILSKESKVSDFRQAWIDSLRSEVSQLVANLHQALKFIEAFGDEAAKNPEHQTAILKANTALFMIRLRLNPTEKPSKEMLRTLKKIEEFTSQDDFPSDEVEKLERDLVDQSKFVLKSEWDRVQKGELTYRLTKLFFIALVGILIACGILIAIRAF